MRILRIAQDYWPCVGGNERWNEVLDRWFSEVAGDEVHTLVLRPQSLFERSGYATSLESFRFDGQIDVPGVPKVKVFQRLLPDVGGLRLARAYYDLIRPFAEGDYDVILSQVGHFHVYPAIRGRPVSLEPGALLLCSYEGLPSCPRTTRGCRSCIASRGLRWWVRDRLKRAFLHRLDIIVAAQSAMILAEIKKVGLEAKAMCFRHIIDGGRMSQRLEDAESRSLKERADRLAMRCDHTFFHFNRLVDYHNPHLALDIVERRNGWGLVFAGDGAEREALERRVEASTELRGRILFLGSIAAESLGWFSEQASGFLLTSLATNSGTSLFESMSLGVGPVFATDSRNFPREFDEEELVVRIATDPERAAAQIGQALGEPGRLAALASAAQRYVETHHSPDQLWEYRRRLLELCGEREAGRGVDPELARSA